MIVIEGTDGSGKGTQIRLLMERLKNEGFKAATFSFPQYGKKSSGLIEEYLNGRYGRPDQVSPYTASLFYALDRFDVSQEIKKALEEGNIVVLDRYVDSNAGHQGGKIKDDEERKRFIKWLYDVEYRILGIPRPDLVMIFHVPAEMGQKLVAQKQERLYIEKGKTYDGHEVDLRHLKNAEKSYLWLAKLYPENHEIIECVRGSSLLRPEEIHELVWQRLKAKGLLII